eukprot:gene4037-2889_t
MCYNCGLCDCCYCISTGRVGIVESCGKFSRTADPGCHCLIPCVDVVKTELPLAVQIASSRVETRTRDNAVVHISCAFHYRVLEEYASTAFYRFANPAEQIGSYAAAVVRGEVPKYTLDELFLTSEEIKKVVDVELREKLREFGFELVSTLVTDIDPSKDVKQAICQTQINAYRRVAAEHQAEINKIVAVKEAEADYEEKRLAGVGLAEERKAIMDGLHSSIEEFRKQVPGSKAKNVMNLLLMNQYFDAMKDIGADSKNKLIMMPGGNSAEPSRAVVQAASLWMESASDAVSAYSFSLKFHGFRRGATGMCLEICFLVARFADCGCCAALCAVAGLPCVDHSVADKSGVSGLIRSGFHLRHYLSLNRCRFGGTWVLWPTMATSCCCCFCVNSSNVGILERFGKYNRTAKPGCHCFFISEIAGTVSLKIQYAHSTIETKTRDNAAVRLSCAFHYRVLEEYASTAFYRFANPAEQIGSYAAAVVRGEVPKYTLDELFLTSEEIKKVVDVELREKLREFGFELVSTLFTEINPSTDVKQAICQTQINAYRRVAAEHYAEINKIVAVKEAEADYEEKRLAGVGLAEERKAIMDGLHSSIEEFRKQVPGSKARDVMNFLLINQYFDAMKEIGIIGSHDDSTKTAPSLLSFVWLVSFWWQLSGCDVGVPVFCPFLTATETLVSKSGAQSGGNPVGGGSFIVVYQNSYTCCVARRCEGVMRGVTYEMDTDIHLWKLTPAYLFLLLNKARILLLSSATEMSGTSDSKAGGPGGVWEVILDHASLQVAKYLASRECVAFEPSRDVACAMLRLLDRSTLHNILSERSSDGLCACFGCTGLPRGLPEVGGNVDVQWYGCDDDNDDPDKDVGTEDDPAAQNAMVRAGTDGELELLNKAADEIVYEDDLYTAESFRLARRDAEQLRRIRRRAAAARQAPSTGGLLQRAGGQLRVLTLPERFCSDLCLDRYQTEIQPRVPQFVDYSDPNIAEVQSTPLMGDITEKSTGAGPASPAAAAGESSGSEILLKERLAGYLATMSQVKNVWDSALSVGSLGPLTSLTPSDSTSAKWANVQRTRSSGPTVIARGTSAVPDVSLPGTGAAHRSTLRGPYLVHDFLMNVCGERCRQLFLLHYVAHRTQLLQLLSDRPQRNDNVFDAITRPLMEKFEEEVQHHPLLGTAVSEPLKVESNLEQQRRAVLARHVFSADSSTTLSRLLLLDEFVLTASAWNAVWLTLPPVLGKPVARHAGAANTFSSLIFPFAVPSPLLMPLHSSRESLELAVVLVLAAACVHPTVLEEFLVGEAEVQDILSAVDVTPADIEAALRLILFPSERTFFGLFSTDAKNSIEYLENFFCGWQRFHQTLNYQSPLVAFVLGPYNSLCISLSLFFAFNAGITPSTSPLETNH